MSLFWRKTVENQQETNEKIAYLRSFIDSGWGNYFWEDALVGYCAKFGIQSRKDGIDRACTLLRGVYNKSAWTAGWNVIKYAHVQALVEFELHFTIENITPPEPVVPAGERRPDAPLPPTANIPTPPLPKPVPPPPPQQTE